MATPLPKQFVLLRGKPVLWYTITAFLNAYIDVTLIIVLPEEHLQTAKTLIRSFNTNRIELATGGSTRYQSVVNGLKLIPKYALVFVHDGVRCLLTPQLIKRCYEATIIHGNAIPAITPVDTVRIVTGSGNELINRANVKMIQTPQTFFSNIIKQAFSLNYHELFTDEASVVEMLGEKIYLVDGEITNIKITWPIDLLIAEKILEERGYER